MTDMMKRRLTNGELRRWGEAIASDNDWDGITAEDLYSVMCDTAGNAYDAGEADWEFDKSDAERMLAIMTS